MTVTRFHNTNIGYVDLCALARMWVRAEGHAHAISRLQALHRDVTAGWRISIVDWGTGDIWLKHPDYEKEEHVATSWF